MTIDTATALALELRQDEIDRCRAMPYVEYLNTPWWDFVHDRTMGRTHGTCELCLERPAREAHHTTYERIGQEKPDDMVALCRNCHQRITNGGLGRLSRRDLLSRRREIMHSPEFQAVTLERMRY